MTRWTVFLKSLLSAQHQIPVLLSYGSSTLKQIKNSQLFQWSTASDRNCSECPLNRSMSPERYALATQKLFDLASPFFDVLFTQAPISYDFNYVKKPVYIQVMLTGHQGKAIL